MGFLQRRVYSREKIARPRSERRSQFRPWTCRNICECAARFLRAPPASAGANHGPFPGNPPGCHPRRARITPAHLRAPTGELIEKQRDANSEPTRRQLISPYRLPSTTRRLSRRALAGSLSSSADKSRSRCRTVTTMRQLHVRMINRRSTVFHRLWGVKWGIMYSP